MTKEKMLVTQALNELKLIDSRIGTSIVNGNFVSFAKTVEKKVTPNTTKEEFNIRAKGDYQSIIALIKRRAIIKAAIVASNAITEVSVNGTVMTVAEAIETKNSIEYEESLLSALKSQLSMSLSNMNSKNIALEDKINSYIEQMLGKEAKIKEDEITGIVTPMRVAGEYSLVDPVDVRKEIEMLDAKISGFKSEVDSALQISNCTTMIEFES